MLETSPWMRISLAGILQCGCHRIFLWWLYPKFTLEFKFSKLQSWNFSKHTQHKELKDIKNELNSHKKLSGVGGNCPSGVSSSSRQTDENQVERKHKPQSHSWNRYTATYRATFHCKHSWEFLPGMERASSLPQKIMYNTCLQTPFPSLRPVQHSYLLFPPLFSLPKYHAVQRTADRMHFFSCLLKKRGKEKKKQRDCSTKESPLGKIDYWECECWEIPASLTCLIIYSTISRRLP